MAMAEQSTVGAPSRAPARRRRRAPVDSRQLAFAWELAPAGQASIARGSSIAVEPPPALVGDAPSLTQALDPDQAPSVEARPSAQNEDGETQALVAIVDLLLDLWRDATGEDLRPSIFEAQNE